MIKRYTNIVLPLSCLATLVSAISAPAVFAQEPAAGAKAPVEIKPLATVTEVPDAESLVAKSSYIVGFNFARQMLDSMAEQGVDVDADQLIKGVQVATEGEELGMTMDEARTVMMAFKKLVEQKQVEKMTAVAEANRKEGDKFRAENGAKDGVKQLPSGVQYEVLKAGEGALPSADDTILVDYTGMFIDGKEFDSSLKGRGGMPAAPVPMPVSAEGLIKGFGEVFALMNVGSKWRVCIPPESAYQVRGRGPIGPNQTLVFEIEVHEIVKQPAGAEANK